MKPGPIPEDTLHCQGAHIVVLQSSLYMSGQRGPQVDALRFLDLDAARS